MKVLKPSSIQALRRSLKPTIIGNQLWPISCALIQNRFLPLSLDAVEGHAGIFHARSGTGDVDRGRARDRRYQRREKFSTESLMYCVERSQAFVPTLSTG